ncbi:MAG: hypothetical protein AAGM04_06560 [Pseudomonadota bacterium]
MSQSENWAMLGYLLEMAMMEAHSLADDRPTVFPATDQKTVVVPDARAQILAERFLNGELD